MTVKRNFSLSAPKNCDQLEKALYRLFYRSKSLTELTLPRNEIENIRFLDVRPAFKKASGYLRFQAGCMLRHIENSFYAYLIGRDYTKLAIRRTFCVCGFVWSRNIISLLLLVSNDFCVANRS